MKYYEKIICCSSERRSSRIGFFSLYWGVNLMHHLSRCRLILQKHKPEEIVNFGSVGSLNKELKGLIEVTKFYQRDMDVRGLMDLKLGETPFDSIQEIITSKDG